MDKLDAVLGFFGARVNHPRRAIMPNLEEELYNSVSNNNIPMVMYLFSIGASSVVKDEDGNNILHVAAKNGGIWMVRTIIALFCVLDVLLSCDGSGIRGLCLLMEKFAITDAFADVNWSCGTSTGGIIIFALAHGRR
ncbi:hypothetical protein Ddc_13518 [Ditylenchus destructor]|nr:hypothetical protein Ddc_13518 [Ditylenchus destructor]